MPKKITIRYKDSSPNWPGDVSSMNHYNMVQGFDGPKYPGYEEPIPGDFLNDTDKNIEYKGRLDLQGNRSYEYITEMEYRKRIYLTGGYHNHGARKFHEAAPPRLMANKTMLKIYAKPRELQGQELENFLWKTKVAVLLFKHFQPLCMELISDIDNETMALLNKKAKEPNGQIYASLIKGPGVIVKPVKEDPEDEGREPNENEPPDITVMDDINAVKMVQDTKDIALLKYYSIQESKKSRPRVAVAIEQQIQNLSQPTEL